LMVLPTVSLPGSSLSLHHPTGMRLGQQKLTFVLLIVKVRRKNDRLVVQKENVMKTRIQSVFIALLLFLSLMYQTLTVHAQGTAFTYQGRLNDGSNPASGIYDLRFAIYDAVSGGARQGNLLTNSPAAVSNGLFTVALDFGAAAFTGADRWLEIGVRTNGSADAYVGLSPRQLLTAIPYAVRAANFSGPVSDSQLSANVARLDSNLVFSGAVQFTNPGSVFSGSFAGQGGALSNLNLTLNSEGAIRAQPFVLSSSLSTGLFPQTVVAADVNGDGRVDLISVNFSSGSLSVFTNGGGGGFVLSSSPFLGGNPDGLAAADVNGDGSVDLVAANGSANTLSVLTNNGNGGFVLASTPGTGSLPRSLAVADVNGDGRLDLIVGNSGAFFVSVLTNKGGGNFAPASPVATSSGPNAVAAADINGDGLPDLIEIDSAIRFYTNNSSGGFAFASFVNAGSNPNSLAVADVNGDGRPDVVSSDSSGNTMSVFTNSGTGSFVREALLPASLFPDSVAAGDFNGDGLMDVACANGMTNTLSVFTNNGNGGFAPALSLSVGAAPVSIVAADVNGDGRHDLISANSSGNSLSVFLMDVAVFSGNGSALTGVNAQFLDGLDPTAFVRLNADQTFTGVNAFNNAANSFAGNGSGLTSLNASSLSSGTVADARLSANVALRAGGNTFTNGQVFNGQIRLDSTDGFSQSSAGNFYVDAPFIVGGRVTVLTNGNFGIGTFNPTNKLHVFGGATFTSGVGGANQAVVWIPGSASWSFTSDRNTKERIEPVDPQSVLERLARLHIAEWSYIGYDQRHIGPMAQDFHAQFPLNGDAKVLNDADLHGVALAAIQGLNQKLNEKDAEILEMKQRLAALEKIVLNQKSN